MNAAWNGQDSDPGTGGYLGSGKYYTGNSSLDNMNINQILSQAYKDQSHLSQDEIDAINYLGAGGENASGSTCFCRQ